MRNLRSLLNHKDSPRKYRGLRYPLEGGCNIVEEARQHFLYMDDISLSFAPSSQDHWSKKANIIKRDIMTLNTASDVIFYAQSKVGFDHRTITANWQQYLTLYEDRLRYEYPQYADLIDQLGDSLYSKPDTLLKYRGRLVSNIYYFHMRELLQCLTYVPHQINVCEIGGGYGSLARLWWKSGVSKKYIIIDLPESLFFAEVYLKVNGIECLYITKPDTLSPEMLLGHDVILCPITFRDSLKGLYLDLVINTGSLGELSEEWVDSWVKWLDEQNCKWFYSMNYFGQPLDDLQDGENLCSILLSPYWTTKILNYNPAYLMLQSPRNFAEMLLHKEKTPQPYVYAFTRYSHNKTMVLDGQTLLEAMDIVRSDNLGYLAWDLLNRCIKEMPRIPKEAYYLARHLNSNASVSFMSQYSLQLGGIFCDLNRIRLNNQEVQNGKVE